MINLRLRAPGGVSTIQVPTDATLSQLQASISTSTGLSADGLDIRTGFPRPQPLPSSDPSASLTSLGIRSGDTLQVSELAETSEATLDAPSQGYQAASTPAPSARAAAPPAPPQKPPPTAYDAFTPSRPPPSGAAPSPLAETPAPRQTRPAAGSKDVTAAVQTEGGFLTLRVVPDDNSCLFRAAGLVLEHGGTPGQDIATKLRNIVADKVRSDPVEWCEPVLGSEPEAYIRKILGESTWGGAIELAILSEHYQTEICSVDVQTGRADRFGEHKSYPSRVILVYSGIHYDALTLSPIDPSEMPPSTGFPPEIGFDTTIFSSSDEGVMSAVVVLVNELRQKHYYTDTATFDLKCEVCGQGLVGEKEARQHAEQTGHTRFGEY